MLDLRLRGRRFEPHRHRCVVSLSKNINPSLVLVQPRKTHPFITERLLMGHKESNQTNKPDTDSSKTWPLGSSLCMSICVYMSGAVYLKPLIRFDLGFVARKPVFRVSDKASFKPVSTATETC